jgi:hypothetical protein
MNINGRKLKMGRVVGALVLVGGLLTGGAVGVVSLFTEDAPKVEAEMMTKKVKVEKPEIKSVEISEPESELSHLALYDEAYINYMVENFSVPQERAEEIMIAINDSHTVLPTAMILGIIQRETKFKNMPAENQQLEDSMGYVQMKSETRHWLRKHYPELPEIGSQSEFQMNPTAQIQYMIKYLEYSAKKHDNKWDEIVSSYNMGMNSKKINRDYTSAVAENSTAIQHAYGLVVDANVAN